MTVALASPIRGGCAKTAQLRGPLADPSMAASSPRPGRQRIS